MNEYYLYVPLKMMTIKDGKINITTVLQAEVYARYQNIFKPEDSEKLPTYYYTIADLLDEIECYRVAAKCRAIALCKEISCTNEDNYANLYTMFKKILPQLNENKLNNIAECLFANILNQAAYLSLEKRLYLNDERNKFNRKMRDQSNEIRFVDNLEIDEEVDNKINCNKYIEYFNSNSDGTFHEEDYYTIATNCIGRYGYKNPFGKWAIDAKYDSIMEIAGLHSVVEIDGKFGAINYRGDVIIEIKYDRITECSTIKSSYNMHIAEVLLDGRAGYIDMLGNEIWEDEISPYRLPIL